MVSWGSKNTPRSRTTSTGSMVSTPKWSCLTFGGSFLRLAAEPNHITSVLPVFSCRRLESHHPFTAETQFSSPTTTLTASSGFGMAGSLHVIREEMIGDVMTVEYVGHIFPRTPRTILVREPIPAGHRPPVRPRPTRRDQQRRSGYDRRSTTWTRRGQRHECRSAVEEHRSLCRGQWCRTPTTYPAARELRPLGGRWCLPCRGSNCATSVRVCLISARLLQFHPSRATNDNAGTATASSPLRSADSSWASSPGTTWQPPFAIFTGYQSGR